jgi:hypothetical protein
MGRYMALCTGTGSASPRPRALLELQVEGARLSIVGRRLHGRLAPYYSRCALPVAEVLLPAVRRGPASGSGPVRVPRLVRPAGSARRHLTRRVRGLTVAKQCGIPPGGQARRRHCRGSSASQINLQHIQPPLQGSQHPDAVADSATVTVTAYYILLADVQGKQGRRVPCSLQHHRYTEVANQPASRPSLATLAERESLPVFRVSGSSLGELAFCDLQFNTSSLVAPWPGGT